MSEKSSDSLKDSIGEFFSNNDIIDKEMYRGIWNEGVLQGGDPGEIYLPIFSSKSCRDSENAPNDSEDLRQSEMSQLSEMPDDNESESVV
jgi:hypothetical protein